MDKEDIHTHTHTHMHMWGLCVCVWRERERERDIAYTHTHTHTHREYYSVIKKKKIMPFVAIWTDLELVILSGVSQRRRNTV